MGHVRCTTCNNTWQNNQKNAKNGLVGTRAIWWHKSIAEKFANVKQSVGEQLFLQKKRNTQKRVPIFVVSYCAETTNVGMEYAAVIVYTLPFKVTLWPSCQVKPLSRMSPLAFAPPLL